MFSSSHREWFTRFFPGVTNRREKIAIALLFLFPLFVNSARHWISSIYSLLFLVSIISITRSDFRIKSEERFFLALLVAHVVSVIISNTVNGWTTASRDWFGVEARYLMAVPIFVFLRKIPGFWKALIYALPVSGVIIGIHAIFDFLNKYTSGAVEIIYAEGIYGHIFMGNIAALLSVTGFLSRNVIRDHRWKALCLSGAALAACATLLSVTRNAWLSLVVLYGLVFFLETRKKLTLGRKQLIVVLASVSVVVVTLFSMFKVDYVQERLKQVYEEPLAYFQADRNKPMEFTSLGFRLEQWRGATIAFLEKPILGHGIGNIGTVGNRLIREGKLNEVVYQEPAEKLGTAAHVHSVYFEYLADTGIIGFAIIVMIMGYPLFLSLKWRSKSENAWKFLMITNVAFLVASLTEIPFIRNNWSSVFLVFNIVYFIWLMNEHAETPHSPEKR